MLTIAQLIGNLSRMAFGFKQIAWKYVGLFLIMALPSAALGTFGFSILPKEFVTRCIGAVLIILVLFKMMNKMEIKSSKKTLLVGGAVMGAVSGLAGSGGPIGAAVFLSLGPPPVAYVASEASTATAMHLLKTIIYGKLVALDKAALLTGVIMGVAMILGTFLTNRMIRKMD